MKQIKLIICILSLTLICGCASNGINNIKEVKVTDIDYNNLKTVDYIKKTDKESKIEAKYNVYNKNFEYIKEKEKNCYFANYVGENASGERYYLKTISKNKLLKVNVYRMKNNKCDFLNAFDDVAALSIKTEIYNNNIYLNLIIFNNTKEGQSGLWLLKDKKKIHLSHFKTMFSDFSVDEKTGNLYTIEYHEKETLFRQYDKKGNKINEKVFDDNLNLDYLKLYIKSDSIYLIKEIIVNEDQDEFNYQVDEYSLKDVFNDIGKNIKKSFLINNRSYDFNTVILSENKDYIIFNAGIESVVCDTEYNSCFRYDSASHIGRDYLLISNNSVSGLDEDALYLTKFGSQGVEKILTFNDSYIYNLNGSGLYFAVYDISSDNDFKLIKYQLKQ